MSKNTDLFYSLVDRRMLASDVRKCLMLSQQEFLSLLVEGFEARTGTVMTRKDFAIIAEFPVKTVYSYFASPDAVDYRQLSNEMRIAILWRFTSKCDKHIGQENPGKKAYFRMYNLKRLGAEFYFSVNDLTDLYKSSPTGSLNFTRGSHWPKVFLSDFTASAKRLRFNRNQFYIVNGNRMSLSEAARALGHKAASGLQSMIKTSGRGSGDDVSDLLPRHRKKVEG